MWRGQCWREPPDAVTTPIEDERSHMNAWRVRWRCHFSRDRCLTDISDKGKRATPGKERDPVPQTIHGLEAKVPVEVHRVYLSPSAEPLVARDGHELRILKSD
ncbi:unnamed protein product [Mycena citricolor]|uniref:Uncharacterized protein n=1 Tax=Mycena citricolor TaxID=2018698 RepID=A0AAD2H2X4_9AGAR|nr:unnamed protein product [Mycena citricolor]